MLVLLAIVCMGGYSQTKSVVCTLDKEAANCTTDNSDFKVSWVYSLDAYAKVENGVQFLAKEGQKSFTLTATMPSSVKISSVTVEAARSSVKKGTKTLEVLIANSSIGTQTITKNTLQDFSFVPITPILSNSLVLQLESSVTEASHFIKTVTIEYEEVNSGLTATTTSFGSDYDNKNFNFVDGVLAGFTPPVATCKTEGVAGTIAYSSSDNDIVTVDNEGKLNFTNTKFGKATITATFTPSDQDKYAKSTATYTVINTHIYNSIADLKKAITSTSTTNPDELKINLTDAVVTYVNGSNAFIQDATAGVLVYMKNHGLNAGDKFTGVVDVKACIYNGLPEITSWKPSADIAKTENVDIPVTEVTLADIAGDNYSKYESVRVKVINVEVTSAMNGQDAKISQNGTELAVRAGVTGLKEMDASQHLDIVGYPGVYNTTIQLNVWEQSDITIHQEADKADPEIAFKETEKTVELKEDAIELSTLISNPHELPITYTSSNAEIAEVSKGVIYMYKTGKVDITAKFAGDDTYNAVEKTLALTIEDSREGVKSIVEITSQEDYTTELKIQKENVTLKCSDGNLKNSTEFRLYGSSNTTISVTSGQIVKIELTGKIKNSIGLDKLTPTPGVYEVATDKKSAVWTGEAASVVFRNTASSQVQVTSIKVYIKETKVPVVLDENDNSNTFEENKDVNVTIKRTFYKDGDWNTLCLPFDVSEEEVKTAFGDDAKLRQVDEANSKGNTVAFTEANAIKAGVPYLIKFDKVAENADQPQEFNHTFEGVTLTKKVEYSVLADCNIIFAGSYSAFTPEDFLKEYDVCDVVASMAAANTLKKVNARTTIKGLRAVFGLASSVQPQAVKVIIDGTATGIGDLHVDGTTVANGRVYNLNGQCVGTSLEGLKAGVYIQNGKKVIINK
ncbi:hypothetical protein CIK92_12035 [Prevotella sp. P4-67]|nr:hypothetical protein CIK92_12035 [Prevotella sp. P4-67]